MLARKHSVILVSNRQTKCVHAHLDKRKKKKISKKWMKIITTIIL